jgi:hypothetical protein
VAQRLVLKPTLTIGRNLEIHYRAFFRPDIGAPRSIGNIGLFAAVRRKDHQGPLANGGGWYDTMDACNCAESMDLAFANKLEIWAKYALK